MRFNSETLTLTLHDAAYRLPDLFWMAGISLKHCKEAYRQMAVERLSAHVNAAAADDACLSWTGQGHFDMGPIESVPVGAIVYGLWRGKVATVDGGFQLLSAHDWVPVPYTLQRGMPRLDYFRTCGRKNCINPHHVQAATRSELQLACKADGPASQRNWENVANLIEEARHALSLS